MHSEILKLAQAASGAAAEEQPLLALLCDAAQQRWKSRLRQGVRMEDCGAAFLCAAAFTAAADLEAGRGGAVEFFTAGEISVRTGAAGTSPAAEALRQTAERLMAPFTEAEDFCFKGVRG